MGTGQLRLRPDTLHYAVSESPPFPLPGFTVLYTYCPL